MTHPDRRHTAASLDQLEKLIERMDSLGAAAEDAAARISGVLHVTLPAASGQQHELVAAIGEVIEIVTERSRLAHAAHRLIVEIRAREMNGWRAVARADAAI